MLSQNNYMLAESYYRSGEYDKAVAYYKMLAERDPYNVSYVYRLASCYQELNKFNLVEQFVNRQKQRNSRLSFLDIIIGYNYERQKQSEKAKQIYKNVLSLAKNTEMPGSIIADLFRKYNKLNYALQAYKIELEKNPKANYGFQMAQIYGEKGNFKEMFDSYIDLVDKNKGYLYTAKRYTAQYINENPENENNILFRKALLRKSASNPKDEWNNLLSWLFVKQEEYSKAFIQEKALYSRNLDNLSGIKQLAEITLKAKDYKICRKCNDFIIEKASYKDDEINAKLRNLKIDINTKQPNIRQKFENLLEKEGINNNTIPIQLDYADYLTFELNKPKEATEVLENAKKVAQRKITKNKIKYRLANIAVFTGKYNRALILYTQIQNAYKNHTFGQEAQYKVAQTSYFKGDFDWAMAQLKVLKGSASQLTANDAANLFVTISDNLPKDSVGTGLKELAKADLYIFRKKKLKAAEVLSNLIKKYKGQDIEDDALYRQAKLFVEKKEIEKAVLAFKRIINEHKESVFIDDSLYNLAEIYNNYLQQHEKAKKYYQKIIFEHPSSIYLVDARKKYRKLRGDTEM